MVVLISILYSFPLFIVRSLYIICSTWSCPTNQSLVSCIWNIRVQYILIHVALLHRCISRDKHLSLPLSLHTEWIATWITLKRQPHEGENLDERIVTISCKRVYGATQARPCETSGCSRQRCAVEVSNETHLFRNQEQLRYPAKNCLCCHWPTLQTPTISVGLPTCREWTGKRWLVTGNQSNS